jgi:serine acetyltransferase
MSRTLGSMVRHLRTCLNTVAMVGPDDRYARRFGHFGRGSAIMAPQGTIYNERYISIGERTLIGPNVCMTAGMGPGQTMLTDPVVQIGDHCIIGRGSHIVGHWSIVLGDDIQTGPYVYITDQNHSYDDPDQPIGWQPPVEAAVEIGSGSWLGANVVILPGTRLGANTVVAAGAVVRGEFGDHVVLAGVPAKVVRHFEPGEGWRSGSGS